MSFKDIDITKKHALALSVARDKTEQVAKQMKIKYGLEYVWAGDTITFQAATGAAAGVKGYLRVTSDTIAVHIELTFAQLGGKPFIVDAVEKYLKDAGIQ